MTIPSVQVDVFWARPSDRAAVIGRALLGPAERDRLVRLQLEKDRIAYAVAHGLLRQVLHRYLLHPAPGDYARGPTGKPALPPADGVEFNLTHAQGLVAVAVSRDVAVGIDVEDLSRPVDAQDLSAQVLSATESAVLAERGWPTADFLRLWVMKEAVAKAAGQGLLADFRALSLVGTPPRIVALPPGFGETGDWATDSLEIDGHLVTVAAPHPSPVWRWHSVAETLEIPRDVALPD